MGNEIDPFKGFSKLNSKERLNKLIALGVLTKEDVEYLNRGGLNNINLGEKLIENVIGYYQIPLGVVTNLKVDGKDYVVPMAVEETSIVAAASKTARWIKENGTIETELLGHDIIGQVQLARIKDWHKLRQVLAEKKSAFITELNREVAKGLVDRGGGVNDIVLREVDRGDGEKMAVLHILANPVDAMGANIMNQVCEYFRHPLEECSGEKVTMCILSNLVDTKLTRAKVILENIDLDLAQRIQEASLFANQDPYRAATNNKGVLNGIDPLLIATGNDWRAVEAGVHAFAVRSGQYRSITEWKIEDNKLVGEFLAPLIVGIVGGVTRLHPTSQMALRMMQVQSAGELSRVAAAMGLVQNLGALRALTTVGIIEGHMKLHIQNLALGAGAEEKEIPLLQQKLESILHMTKRISLAHAIEALKEIRQQGSKEINE